MTDSTATEVIHARWICPVIPEDQLLEGHALAFRDGRILAILPGDEARARYPDAIHHERPDHLLIPGLINAHTHAAMTLLRGLADDLPLMTWLNEHIWPAEGRWIGEELVADGTRLAVAEMLRGGVTCFNDMYFYPDVTARVCDAAGMRAVVGLIMVDFPTAWAANHDEYIQKGLAVYERYRNHPLIHAAFAPHAPYSVSDAPLVRIRTLAEELGCPIHIHVHETQDEVRMGIESHGKRPLRRLRDLDLISPALVAVHMTQLEPDEIALLAEAGAHVVHCPESNQKLASGTCPVAELMRAGVNVALGTDGAASNNDLDMLGEMRAAALLAKGQSGDPAALPAEEALRMATIHGARALGLADEIGSLEPGKSADLVAVDLGALETQPVYHPVSHLIYATGRHQVSDVWIAGRQLLKGRRLTTLDTAQILARTREWGARIAAADATVAAEGADDDSAAT